MQLADAREIIECLPKSKTRFYYFKDRYALLLLRLAIAGGTSKKALQQSRFAKLLDKEVVKEAIRLARGKPLSGAAFDAYWPARYECYFLTLGVWGSRYGGWEQTSRPGYNLVLQLNFPSEHNEAYRKLVDPEGDRPFEYYGHPIAQAPMHTLAWSRLDIDLASGEALIEEVQTDWIREAQWARRAAVQAKDSFEFYGTEMNRDRVIRYVDSVLRRHEETWDEAMLSATLRFLREELGVRSIFYHTHESGARLKRIQVRLPPRSVYTQLPRRFCFEETTERPGFLPPRSRPARARPRYDNARFSLLELN
ncbi:MAG: hypothetical protein AAGE85_01665 [Pseudomonadota bacterium]